MGEQRPISEVLRTAGDRAIFYGKLVPTTAAEEARDEMVSRRLEILAIVEATLYARDFVHHLMDTTKLLRGPWARSAYDVLTRLETALRAAGELQ